MRYFDWDDAHLTDDLAPEFAFTRTYREHSGKGLALREAACLAVALPASALPVKDGDWFVGRRVYRPLGISPSYWNDETDGLDHVSYYADLDRLRRVAIRPNQTPDAKHAIDEMITFWAHENVNAKARAKFDDIMRREIPSDLWTRDSGAIFGLYRLAGAQLDYDKLVRIGLSGMKEEISRRGDDPALNDTQKDFLRGLLSVLDTMYGLLAHYERELTLLLPNAPAAEQHRFTQMIACLNHLQSAAPASLMEAIQLVWLYSSFSGTLDFGRADEYLGDLYAHDIDTGVLNHDQAITLLLSFYRLMHEVHNRDTRMILGGKARRNEENADRFALIAMEASALHGEMQPQVSLRMYRGMNPAVRKAALDFLEKGMSYPILYNDEASIRAVRKSMKVDEREAERYAFFGCGEYVIDHCSMGTPNDIINLPKVLEITLHEGYDPVGKRPHGLNFGAPESFDTFEKLRTAYRRQCEYFTGIAARHQRLVYDTINENGAMLMMSMLTDDCIRRAKSALDGGIRYLAGTFETYGNITVADSLTAIRKTVYEDKTFTLRQLIEMLDADFRGFEEERKRLMDCPKFGNDNDEADAIARDINTHMFDFTAAQAEAQELSSYLVVMINNDANVVLGRRTQATADGRRAWSYLSNGNGPMAGMDKDGLPSLLRSMASTDMSKTAGTAQNLKLSRSLFTDHREQFNDMLDTAFDMGILSFNLSVMSQKDLEDAMIHPEKYPNLFVRVGGFSARFVQLDPGTQQDVLHRTMY